MYVPWYDVPRGHVGPGDRPRSIEDLGEAPCVHGLGARIVERRVERARRHVLLAPVRTALEGEAPVPLAGEELQRALGVRVVRDAVVGLRAVVRRVEEILGTVHIEDGARREHVDAALRHVTDGRLAPLATEAPGLDERLHALRVATGHGHDVDDGEERVAAVEGGSRAADHLDVVDRFEIDPEVLAEIRLLVEVVVVRVSVDEQQDAVVEVVRTEKSPDADVVVVAIAAHIEAGDRAQDLRESAVSEAIDLVPGDHGHACGRVARRLRVLRRRRDLGILEEEELVLPGGVVGRGSYGKRRDESSGQARDRAGTGHGARTVL
jgi:hypothetical protein